MQNYHPSTDSIQGLKSWFLLPEAPMQTTPSRHHGPSAVGTPKLHRLKRCGLAVKTDPRGGNDTLVLHTKPHHSTYVEAVTPNWNFSAFWQQILFTQVDTHTQNYSIRTLFSIQESFDRKCSICPNQWGLSISQNIFLNWNLQCQSGRTSSLDNLSPKAGTDLFLIKVTFKILLLFSQCCWERGREGGCMPAAESHGQS